MTTDVLFNVSEINRCLVGATILNPITDPGEEYFGLVVSKVGGKPFTVWIDRDAEGNGPGFLKVDTDTPVNPPA